MPSLRFSAEEESEITQPEAVVMPSAPLPRAVTNLITAPLPPCRPFAPLLATRRSLKELL